MKCRNKFIAAVVLLVFSAPLVAQQTAQEPELAEQQRRAEEAEVMMREAEVALEEAARRVAELSAAQLARAGDIRRQWAIATNRPMIGINIGGPQSDGPVEGILIDGITPGGAAEEAGLRAGDIIIAVNDEPMSSENAFVANSKLLEFMSGVEEGDVLDIEYLRDNQPGEVELTPKVSSAFAFNFDFDGEDFTVPVAPDAPQVYAYRWLHESRGHGFGDMEMVELNESLGRYFGTDTGLLIVKAPADNAFRLQDGDVILSIDGRAPKDLHHAVRILSSYEAGETVNFEIMRDKRRQTVTVEVPDARHSMRMPRPAAAPAAATAPSPPAPRVPRSDERT